MPQHIEVPHESLSRDALAGLVEEFITREGTDYGHREDTLEQKRAHVMRQIEKREIAIIFDFESESTTLVTRDELSRLSLT